MIGLRHIGWLAVVPLAGACWKAPAPAGTRTGTAVSWEARIEVASGGGLQGPWRQNRSRYDYVDDAAVALDDDGGAAVAWVDQARRTIFFQRYAADGTARLPAPVAVSRSPDILSWLPRMAVTGDRIYVVWQEIIFSGGSHGGEIFFARSTDGGRSFDPPVNLSRSRAGDGKGRLTLERWHNGSFDLAIAPEGALHVAWTEFDGPLWLTRTTDGGDSFSAPLHVAGDGARPARGPSLAVAGGGMVHLAWTVGEDRAADIHVASSVDGGYSFGEVAPVRRTPGHCDAPSIALGDDGTLHLVHAERSGRAGYHIFYSRRRPGERAFSAPIALSRPLARGFSGASYPSLRVVGRALFVLWKRYPMGAVRPVGLGYASSTDAGRSFSAPAVVPGTGDPTDGENGSLQGLLMRQLAVDASGAIALVHSAFRRGRDSRIWLIRGRMPLR